MSFTVSVISLFALLVDFVYLQVVHENCVIEKPTIENDFTLIVSDLKKCEFYKKTYSIKLKRKITIKKEK